MATERLESLEQVRAFVEGSDGLDFIGSDRPSRNDFVRRCEANAMSDLESARLVNRERDKLFRTIAAAWPNAA